MSGLLPQRPPASGRPLSGILVVVYAAGLGARVGRGPSPDSLRPDQAGSTIVTGSVSRLRIMLLMLRVDGPTS